MKHVLKLTLCFIPAAAAMSLQSCPTLYNPLDGSQPGSSVPGVFQARILEWVAIAFSYQSLTRRGDHEENVRAAQYGDVISGILIHTFTLSNFNRLEFICNA